MKAEVKLYRYEIPFRSPLTIGEKILSRRQGLLLSLMPENQETRWGEIAPLPGYSDETLSDTQSQIVDILRSSDLSKSQTGASHSLYPSVSFGLSSVLDPLEPEELPHLNSFEIARLLSGSSEEILQQASEIQATGLRPTVKIKIGRNHLGDEADLIWKVSELLSGTPLRLDANRKWTLSQALEFAKNIRGCPMEFIEEPVHSYEDLPKMIGESGLPVALDETLRMSPEAALRIPAAAWVLKPTVLGSLSELKRWIHLAERHSIVPVLSSTYETGVGTSHILRLANLISNPKAIGLDPYFHLQSDLLVHPLTSPRHRVEPDLNALTLIWEAKKMELKEMELG